MKSYGQLWERIISEKNLREAWRLFRRHHSTKMPVIRYHSNLDENLRTVRRRLLEGTWVPSEYRQFMVYEPKPRMISCVSLRDRVVHHAFCNVCAPLMERRFIDQSYACRKGRGSHMAVTKARQLCGRYRYFLKLDVRHYFASVDHKILISILKGMFRERKVIDLASQIIQKPIPDIEAKAGCAQTGKGLPIGNLTSQWFANLYLDGLDHFAVETLRLGNRYLRYMDDMLVFADSKEEAWQIRQEVADWLARNRSLELKEEATRVAPVTEGVPFLGLHIWRNSWRLRRTRLRRTRRSARRHYKALVRGECSEEEFQNVIRSMDGAANWYGFRGIFSRLDAEFAATWEKMGSESNHASGSRSRRRIRGGNYNNSSDNCSSWYRNRNTVGNTNDNIGFRLASTCARPQNQPMLHKSHLGCSEPRDAGTNMQSGGPERVGANAHKASVPAIAPGDFEHDFNNTAKHQQLRQ